MKWFHWLGFMLVGAAFVLLATLAVHNANAATHPVADEEPGPKWKIVVTMEGPPGKQELAYGDKENGIHWYATLDECKKAIKGDPKLGHGLKLLHEQIKQTKMPIDVKVECKPDNSV